MFSVEPLPAATDAGLTETVGPAGETDAGRLTGPGVPTCVVLIVLVAVAPVSSETLVGFAEMVKSAGGGAPPQLGSLNEVMRVLQLKLPDDLIYSFVYQNVQSSTGSIPIML